MVHHTDRVQTCKARLLAIVNAEGVALWLGGIFSALHPCDTSSISNAGKLQGTNFVSFTTNIQVNGTTAVLRKLDICIARFAVPAKYQEEGIKLADQVLSRQLDFIFFTPNIQENGTIAVPREMDRQRALQFPPSIKKKALNSQIRFLPAKLISSLSPQTSK